MTPGQVGESPPPHVRRQGWRLAVSNEVTVLTYRFPVESDGGQYKCSIISGTGTHQQTERPLTTRPGFAYRAGTKSDSRSLASLHKVVRCTEFPLIRSEPGTTVCYVALSLLCHTIRLPSIVQTIPPTLITDVDRSRAT